MVKQEDENSSSSSVSSSSSFSSASKTRKQKTQQKDSTNIAENSTNQLIYSSQPTDPLFKLNSLSNSNNFRSQSIQIQNLASMKNVTNQLVSTNSNATTSINEQVYFQNSTPSSASEAYKIPVGGTLQHLTSASSNNLKDLVNIGKNNHLNRVEDKVGLNSNCSNSSNSSNGSFNNSSNHTGEIIVEQTVRKREMRLLKNREAARECRRKKKEYIKCLEDRVAVLENQNKALIDELKSLKELYCQNGDPKH